MMAFPLVEPVIVTEHVARLGFVRLARAHVVEVKETEPVLLIVWVQSTVPVGR
jgi:hypothetical protein